MYIIFPIIGVILTNFFGMNILCSYYKNRINLIHEYNEIQFTIILFTSINWMIYGIVSKNIFLYVSNIFTLFSSFGFIQILYKHLEFSKLIYIELISLIFLTYIIAIVFIINFINLNKSLLINITGTVCTTSSILSYFSPIIIIKKVIETNDNTLIYLPYILIGLVNLSFWLCYGIIINDIYQILTDSFSLLICIVQIIIYVINIYKKNIGSIRTNLFANNGFNIIFVRPQSDYTTGTFQTTYLGCDTTTD